MSKEEKKINRRDFLFTASYSVGAVGLGAVIWPLVHQLTPAKAQQALATTEVDISQVEPGKSITVLWRGKPVFLKRRTQEEITEARSVSMQDLPDPQKDEDRVKKGKDEWLVMLGVCTHLGCVPLKDKGDYKGWFCPCHGSHYDLSGRIRKGPAPTNMEIPKFEFVNNNTIKIG
jgi:ubiquinol-cytochrome c reductase iron-sulfur subunit